MSVVVVGPRAVTGGSAVDAGLATAALDAIDDRLAVHDGRVVPVAALWDEVAAAAVVAGPKSVTLVVPTAWSTARVEVAEAALLGRCAAVRVRRRGVVLFGLGAVVVEFGSGAAVVTRAVGDVTAVATRHGADALLDVIGDCASVVLDVPTGVAIGPAEELDRRCRRRGLDVVWAGDDDVVALALDIESPCPKRSFDVRRLAVAAGVVVAVALLAGAALRAPPGTAPAPTGGMWVVEGRVAVEVPTAWTVRRVVSGPGSARVEMTAPDSRDAVYLTQAVVPVDETVQATGRALEAALRREPAGVFADFASDVVVADRPAVSYSETRGDTVVAWTVLVERGVRIAIGCRSPRTADCEHAVGSARTLGEIG